MTSIHIQWWTIIKMWSDCVGCFVKGGLQRLDIPSHVTDFVDNSLGITLGERATRQD